MDHELSLFEYLPVFRKRWRLLAALPPLAGIVGGSLTLWFVPRIYEARTTVLLPQPESDDDPYKTPGGIGDATMQRTSGGAIDTYRAILQSQRLQRLLISQFSLIRRLGAANEEEALRRVGKMTAVAQDAKAGTLAIKVSLPGTPRLSRRTPWGANDADARKLSAALANAYVRYLIDYLRDNFVFQSQQNRAFIEKQRSLAEKDLKSAEDALVAFQNAKRIVALPEQTKAIIEQQADLTRDLTAAELELRQASSRLGALKSRLLDQAKAGNCEAVPEAQAVVAEARRKLLELEVEFAVKSESLQPSHPEVRQLSRQIEETKSRLKSQLAEAYGNVEKGLVTQLVNLEVAQTAADAKSAGLKRALSSAESRLSRLPNEALEYGRLQRTLEVKQELFKLLSTEFQRAQIAESHQVPQIQVLDAAVPPTRKSSPSGLFNAALTALLSLLLAVGFVVMSEHWERALACRGTGSS